MQVLYANLIKELHQYAKNQQYQRAVLGLSGGLDSALLLCIAVRAFGPRNVTALILPEIGLTSNDDIEHAKVLAKHFGVQTHYQPINNFLVDFNFLDWDKTESANRNLKSQARHLLLRHYSESHNALYLDAANKSDFALGFGIEDGEFGGELHIFGDLYKTDLMKLGEFIGLPQEILDKAPSRGLKAKQNDEHELSGPWGQIDDILQQLAEGMDPGTLIEKGMDSLLVHKINRLVEQNIGRFQHANVLPLGKISESITRAREVEASST